VQPLGDVQTLPLPAANQRNGQLRFDGDAGAPPARPAAGPLQHEAIRLIRPDHCRTHHHLDQVKPAAASPQHQYEVIGGTVANPGRCDLGRVAPTRRGQVDQHAAGQSSRLVAEHRRRARAGLPDSTLDIQTH
jgi:hypothetical protein